MLPRSDIDRQNRRGCFVFLAVVLLAVSSFAYLALSTEPKPETNQSVVVPVR